MKKKLTQLIILFFLLSSTLFTTCLTNAQAEGAVIKSYKALNARNPILTQAFGADPSVLVYNGRVYIYMTGDTLEYESNGEIKTNSYSTINTIRVISGDALANWFFQEPIKAAGYDGIAKWANRSWAPAVICKKIDGKDKFFLYFSNNANGVGVLTSDSPLGPWIDPLNRALITRQTPNCSDIPWVFDPAVFIDDDGKGYLYFGGGVPSGKEADPGSARVVALNNDMISLAGDPVKIYAPYFFEASLMNKINGKYIFSYCTNWSVSNEAKTSMRIDNAVIAIMSGNNPMGPFTLERTLFRNPGSFFGVWGNNHHDIFEFNGQWYLAYHSQLLEDAMDIDRKGYRAPHIDAIKMNNGMFESVTGTKKGVDQAGRLNPFLHHQGALSGNSAEVSFGSVLLQGSNEPCEYAQAQSKGSWLGVFGADFDTFSAGNAGAKSITIYARTSGRSGAEIRIGSPDGELAGLIGINKSVFNSYNLTLNKTIDGVNDIFFVFEKGFVLGGWQFNE